ncbi:MAG: o-succinylbenzoate synthase [Trueperaceae bacterium]|nr:o-succinylbenzoate synthase [Trueperaceae bacterium]
MRIDRIELREVGMRLEFTFRTSFGAERDRRILLLHLHGEGFEGIAECVAGASPGYSSETVDTCWTVIERFIAPQLVGRAFATPDELLHALSGVRGHDMAVAAVEMAFWDLQAKALNVPLWVLLGGRDRPVPVGVSLGIQDDVAATVTAARRAVAEGYRRVKLKIRPGWDVDVVRAVREALPEVPLTVDANSAYRLTDARRLRELDALALDYVEQPLAHDDLLDHAALQRQLATPICLDESIHGPEDARKALQLEAGRVVNVKVGRVRGFRRAREVHDVARAFGAPVWCGGMLETGVGRAANLHLSTLDGFVLPGDTSSASRYYARDLVEQPLEAEDGVQRVPAEGPGLGVTLDRAWLAERTVRVRMLEVGKDTS